MKYTESDYQKEYNEIIEVYEEQMKPLKNKWLIAFISICTIISTIVFLQFAPKAIWRLVWVHYGISTYLKLYYFLFCMIYIVPGTYFIRLCQVIKHKKRRLKNLEEKKMQAVSSGTYDANS